MSQQNEKIKYCESNEDIKIRADMSISSSAIFTTPFQNFSSVDIDQKVILFIFSTQQKLLKLIKSQDQGQSRKWNIFTDRHFAFLIVVLHSQLIVIAITERNLNSTTFLILHKSEFFVLKNKYTRCAVTQDKVGLERVSLVLFVGG
jgi:hypothetical protein